MHRRGPSPTDRGPGTFPPGRVEMNRRQLLCDVVGLIGMVCFGAGMWLLSPAIGLGIGIGFILLALALFGTLRSGSQRTAETEDLTPPADRIS